MGIGTREDDVFAGGLLDRLGVAATVVDSDGRITLWGPGAERLFGYSAAEALLRNARELLVTPEGSAMSRQAFDHLPAGTSLHGVVQVRHKDGTPLRVEFQAMRLDDVHGEVYTVSLAADAESVRRVETKLALSAALIQQSAVGVAVFDTDLRWVSVNPALERVNGVPEEAVVGRRVSDALPHLDVSAIDERLRRVLATGEPLLDQQTVGRTPADPERDHAWSESYYRLDDPYGQPLGVVMSIIDISERHRAAAEVAQARERLAVLAEAGVRIGTTLDLRQTARELTQVAVPRLADLARVDALSPVVDGETATAPPPGEAAWFTALAVEPAHLTGTAAADPVGATARHGPSCLVTRCVREARPVVLPHVDQATARSITDDEAAASALLQAGVHSCLAAPLVARGEVLGTVTLLRTGNPRPFDEQDCALAGELAARAAVCVDNARLYGRERDTALTLQRSLLPQEPPDQQGLEIAFRYRPAGTATEIGGDWFDVLPLADGKLGLVVGDVMGKGVRAAAVMGQLRTATRALARLDLPPAGLLQHLDDIASTFGEFFATCVYAVCDPADGHCELSTAGHLPPVVVAPDGTGAFVDIPAAVPLGVGGVPFGFTELHLPEGALLALYTDGLVESRHRPIDVGLTALLRLLGRAAPQLEEICDTALDTLCPAPEDDVALLLARRRPA